MGASLAQAFSLMWLINRACEVQMASMPMGTLREIAEEICKKCIA